MPREMTVSKGQPAKPSRRRSEAHGHDGHHPAPNLDSSLAKRVMARALNEFLKRDDLPQTEVDIALALELRLIQELRSG